MFDIMRYKANLNTFSLKKLNENDKFVFNNIIVNNKLKNL
jgi:hypothetical protein